MIDIGDWDREEQLQRNQAALRRLEKMMEDDQGKEVTEEEREYFELFKKIVDAERPPGRNLYS